MYVKLYMIYEIVYCLFCMKFIQESHYMFGLHELLTLAFWNLINFLMIIQCVFMYFFAEVPRSIGEIYNLISESKSFQKRMVVCLLIKFIMITTEIQWNVSVLCFHLIEFVGMFEFIHKSLNVIVKPKSKV